MRGRVSRKTRKKVKISQPTPKSRSGFSVHSFTANASPKVTHKVKRNTGFDFETIRLGRTGSAPAVQPRVQPKLKIGKSGDRFEKEADTVADKVMSMPQKHLQRSDKNNDGKITEPKGIFGQITPLVQREAENKEEETAQGKPLIENGAVQRQEEEKEEETARGKPLIENGAVQRQEEEKEEETAQGKPLTENGTIQREEEEKEEETARGKPLIEYGTIQREEEEKEEETARGKFSPGAAPTASSSLSKSVNSMKGGGSPLSNSIRSFMETRFGANFKSVRIHTDARAADTSDQIRAKAFTVGNNIAFNRGQYSPNTNKGKHLLAHELTHVIQQNGKKGVSKKNESAENPPIVKPANDRFPISRTPSGTVQRVVGHIIGGVGLVAGLHYSESRGVDADSHELTYPDSPHFVRPGGSSQEPLLIFQNYNGYGGLMNTIQFDLYGYFCKKGSKLRRRMGNVAMIINNAKSDNLVFSSLKIKASGEKTPIGPWNNPKIKFKIHGNFDPVGMGDVDFNLPITVDQFGRTKMLSPDISKTDYTSITKVGSAYKFVINISQRARAAIRKNRENKTGRKKK
jgi:hypothetical protein